MAVPPGMVGQGPPPGLMQALAAQMQGGQGGPPDAGPPQGGADPLAALQKVIQDLHELLTLLDDPADVQVATQCLGGLSRIQTKMMSQGGGGR